MQQSALRRLLGLLGLLRFLGRPPRRRSCRSHPWISRRDSSPRRRRSHLARSADAGWAARALTRGTLLSKGWRTEEPQSGSEKKSLFHVRPLGWSLQDNARTVRVGYGRRIRRMPLGVNARQKTGFLSGVQAVGNEAGLIRARVHCSARKPPLWNQKRPRSEVLASSRGRLGGGASSGPD